MKRCTAGYLPQKRLYQGIAQLSSMVKGKILDLGCGNKPYKELFEHTDYIGIDTFNSGHPHQDSAADIYYDGHKMPFEDNSFDAIICFQVVEHISDINLTLSECKRVLKKEGLLLITAPLLWPEHERPYDFRRWTSIGLKAHMEEAKFDILRHSLLGTPYDVITAFALDHLWSDSPGKWRSKVLKIISWIANTTTEYINRFDPRSFEEGRTTYFDNIILCKSRDR